MKKILLLGCILAIQSIYAQIISKDPSFASNGIFTMPGNLTFSMVQDPGGSIYFTHNVNTYPGINVTESYLSKLTSNGIPDTAFGTNGTVQLPYNSYLNEVKIQTDGKLIVFGFTNSESVAISRILPNGQSDSTFGTNGTVVVPSLVPDQDYSSYGIIVQNDKILVHAINYGQNVQHQHIILRLNANGSIDNTFGNNGYAATQGSPSGRTFVRTDNQSNIICFNSNGGFIQKFNSNGQPMANFGNNGVVSFVDPNGFGYGGTSAVFVDSNNRILCALGSSGDVKRINTDGTIDNTFNYNLFTSLGLYGGSWINCIVEKDGFYYAAGEGSPDNFISKINQTGSLDPVFGNYLQTDSNVEDMIVNNNNIIVRGSGYIVKYLLNTPTLSTADATKASLDIAFENPVKQNLVFSAKEKIRKIEIYSLDGKLIKTVKENHSNVSDLSKRSYMIKVIFENGKFTTKKLIKI